MRSKNKRFGLTPGRAWLLIAPTLVILAIVIVYPVIRALVMSFSKDPGLDPATGMFVTGGSAGFDNYTQWMGDGEGNTVDYGQGHVHRLMLIRALSETAGLSVAQIGEVLTVLSRHPESAFQAMGATLAATHRDPQFSLGSEGTAAAA